MEETLSERIGKELKKALEARNMTQRGLAEQVYVTPQAVSKWISGESVPTTDNLVKIYEVLGVELVRDVLRARKRSSVPDMKYGELTEINDYKAARAEAVRLLDEAGIVSKYAHSVNMLLQWLLTAVIGLSYHQMIHSKGEGAVGYGDIVANLSDYLGEDCMHYQKGLYENELEYSFYLMGMDLFESFDEDQLVNNEYCQETMNDWYRFKEACVKKPASTIYCELRVAIAELLYIMEQ